MIEILTASTNKGKTREIEQFLNAPNLEIKLISLHDLGILAECPEHGTTFMENAVEKALFYSSLAGDYYTLAEDSGLSVTALDGRPGVFSARYAGTPANDENNITRLLAELNSSENRQAKFVTALTLARQGKIVCSFIGEVTGVILREKRGNNGFGYDPVFYYPPLQKTFAELSTPEKNKISHRAAALQQLKDFLSNRLTMI